VRATVSSAFVIRNIAFFPAAFLLIGGLFVFQAPLAALERPALVWNVAADRLETSPRQPVKASGRVVLEIKDSRVEADNVALLPNLKRAQAWKTVSLQNESFLVRTEWMALDCSQSGAPCALYIDPLGNLPGERRTRTPKFWSFSGEPARAGGEETWQ